MTKAQKIKELRETADRMEASINASAGPSSQEWISPERADHYRRMASEKRREADELEKGKR